MNDFHNNQMKPDATSKEILAFLDWVLADPEAELVPMYIDGQMIGVRVAYVETMPEAITDQVA